MSVANVDNLIKAFEEKCADKSIGNAYRSSGLFSFRVENGMLYRTEISRSVCAYYLPIKDSEIFIEKGEPLVSEDTAEEFLESINEGIEEGEGEPYSLEDFFVEVGDEHYYSVNQSVVPVNDVVKAVWKKATQEPFHNAAVSFPEIFNSAYSSEQVEKHRTLGLAFELKSLFEGVDWTGDFDEELDKALLSFPKDYQDAVREYLKNEKLGVASVMSFVDEQRDSAMFYSPCATSPSRIFSSLWNKDGVKIASTSLVELLGGLPGMSDIKDLSDKITWGVDYDLNNKTLFCTLNGQPFEHQRYPTMYRFSVEPSVLSVALSGICAAPSGSPLYSHLQSDKGKGDLEHIKSLLPEPKVVFEKMVNEKLGSFEFQLITAGDKPHGLYLSEDRFIPLAEVLNNKNVFHVLSVGNACRNGELVEFTCMTEYVFDGNSYLCGRGWEGETEKTEDRIINYPDHCSYLYLKGDEIVKMVRCEGKKCGEESVSSDLKNKGLDYDHNIDGLVSSAAFAAALFSFRDNLLNTMRQA